MKTAQKILVFGLVMFLSFIFLGGFPVYNSSHTALAVSLEDSEAPTILPRSLWDNTPELQALMTWLPQNQVYPSDWQPVERIVVHDTATPNADPLDVITRIQSIYRFHAVTNGWGDIGYNYLIDRDGKIYAGRLGGNGSRGAHAFNTKLGENFNYGSIGISLIGSFSSEPVPAVMEQSLEKLIGWLAAINNLDPTITQKTFAIWNPNTSSFSSSYIGAVVVGHKDIDATKSDPATLDFPAVRLAAAQYKLQYAGFVYQASGSSKIYQLINGSSKIFETVADFLAQGNSYQKLATIAQSQLDLFSASRFLKYPDGSLVQFAGSPSIYLIDGGMKRNLAVTAAQFTKLSFDWAAIKKISESELNLYPNGEPIVYGPDNVLIKDPSGKIYFIENGRRRWVTSQSLFGALGYKWNKIKIKSADYVASLLAGANMSYPDGTLAKGSGPTVYLIENGQKREFLSTQSFASLGYKSAKIISAAEGELILYPDGPFMTYKNGTLARAENDSAVYKISGNQKLAFVSAEQFLNLGNQWKNILMVSPAELDHYSSAGNVPYPDGTLVQQTGSPNIYQVKSGLVNLIPDAATFKKLKLSWSKILKISANDFSHLFGAALTTANAAPVAQSQSIPLIQTPAQPAPLPTSASPSQGGPSVSSAIMPNIRVGVWSVPSSQARVVFSANGPYDVYDKNGLSVVSKQNGEQFSVDVTSPSSAFAKLVPRAGTILEIVSFSDPAWNNVTNYNKFRGNLELVYSNKSNKLWVVNELPLEDYLKGVAETNQGLSMEYLKTMAVAARTYAYHYEFLGGKYGADEVYYITNTTSDQLYKGYAREQFASDIVVAQTATDGEIATYNGSAIVTAYSSGAPELLTSGSKSACSVWGGKYCQPGFEYLAGGVKDPSGTTYSYDACGSGNHCVGLSGAGTRALTAQGKTYKEILRYYYPGITIQKLY